MLVEHYYPLHNTSFWTAMFVVTIVLVELEMYLEKQRDH